MKFKFLSFLILFSFIVGISNVYAEREKSEDYSKQGDNSSSNPNRVVSDEYSKSESTLLAICHYKGQSFSPFRLSPTLPATALLPFPGSEVTISATSSSDDFQISVDFKYFAIDGYDSTPISPEQVEKIIMGETTESNEYIQSGNAVGVLKSGFSRIVNSKGNDSVVYYPSLDSHNKFVNRGICPDNIAISLEYDIATGRYNIKEVSFEKYAISSNMITNSAFVADFLGLPVYHKAVSAIPDTARFGDTDKFIYNSYDANKCLSAKEVEYYKVAFDIVSKHSANQSLIKMYKNNKFGGIANSIVAKYTSGSSCFSENPELSSEYTKLSESAAKALKVINSYADPISDYKNECQYILGDPSKAGSFAYYLDLTFRFIKFVAPLVVIVLSIFDYIKAITSSDADIITKTNKKTLLRLVFALLLFILPIIISYILTLLGVQGKCEFNNIPGI